MSDVVFGAVLLRLVGLGLLDGSESVKLCAGGCELVRLGGVGLV